MSELTWTGRGILLDIEGTTSSIRFVYDVMFPQARRELASFLEAQWDDDAVRAACEQVARDAGSASLEAFGGVGDEARVAVQREVERLMDADVKATGLKELQGLIWKSGFESGEMKSHVYDDVQGSLTHWREAGFDIRIYSSGSVAAQRLFFGHTQEGDFLPYFSGFYDTKIGPKKEASSYARIAEDFGFSNEAILFLSDNLQELDAAREAGMQTGLARRPENPAIESPHSHPVITSFENIESHLA